MPRFGHAIIGLSPPLDCQGPSCDTHDEASFYAEHERGGHVWRAYLCKDCAEALNENYMVWPFKEKEDDDGKKLLKVKIAKQAFEKAKVRLIRNHTFYGTLLLNMEIIWDETVPIAGIDGLKLWLNPLTTYKLKDPQWDWLLVHEIQHTAHLHSFRKRGRDHLLWNMSCDYVVNWLISKESGFIAPTEDLLLDERFADQSPEYIYNVLREEERQNQQQQQNAAGSGDESGESEKGDASANGSQTKSGSDSDGGDSAYASHREAMDSPDLTSSSGLPDRKQASPDNDSPHNETARGEGREEGNRDTHVKVDWLNGDVMEPTDLDAMEADAIQAKIKQITCQAAYNAQAMGQDLSVARATIEAHTPKQIWQVSMQNFVASSLDKDDYSYRRPNKRYYQQGLYMPSMDGRKPPRTLACVIDISGSIDKDQLKLFWEELGGIIQLHPNISFHTYFVNTKIRKYERISLASLPLDFKIRGGGGTRFSPAFEDIANNGYEISGLIYFTDMECTDYPSEPTYPVMWLNFGRPNTPWKPPFGETVDMIQ